MINSNLLDLDSNRDVIIISHPRSGSMWLQSCLPHVNCFEPFSKFLEVNFQGDYVNCVLLKEPKQYSESEMNAFVADRILRLSNVTKPKAVKIHSFYLRRPDILNWINAQNATVVVLERRDKLKAFKSLLVAYSLNAYMGPIDKSSVTVDMNMAAELYRWIDNPIIESDKTKLKHKIQTVYYEDLMLENKLVSSNPPISQQNTTNTVVENWHEIHNHVLSLGLMNTA